MGLSKDCLQNRRSDHVGNEESRLQIKNNFALRNKLSLVEKEI